ncbi:MAG: LamG-like jellyroll fold domain-containing protein, partial [Anaerohalosphaeraceae bacterium]
MNRNVLWCGFFAVIFVSIALSAPHGGEIYNLAQPDGSTVQVKVYGDEYYQYVETLDGYTVIRNPQTGWIEYAQTTEDDSEFVATGLVYDDKAKTDPNHPVFQAFARQAAEATGKQGKLDNNKPFIEKKKRLRKDAARQKALDNMKLIDPKKYAALTGDTSVQASQDISAAGDISAAPLLGSVIGLTILIDFSDQPATISQAEIEKYCNQPGYTGYSNVGSVYDYFYDVSNGKLQYTNYVTAYYRAKNPKSYYEGDCSGWGKSSELINEAVRDLDAKGFDFRILTLSGTRVKALNFFYAGDPSCGWSKGLWPHMSSWSGYTSDEGVTFGSYQMSNIGSSPSIYVFCHENGHMVCGYPDLYDYGGESSGVGNFCVMCGRPNDKKPVPPCGYLRSTTGWETVIDISSDPAGALRQHTANTNVSFKYTNPNNSREFFMIESRLKTGRSEVLPAEGLLIWHVDEDGSNNNQEMTPASHYKVSLEQADGAFHLEKNSNGGDSSDSFRAGYKDQFDDYTSPNSRWWDGTVSDLSLTQISAISGQMSFLVGASAPAGYWKFNGNGNDSSGAGKTLTLFGSPAWSSDTWKGGMVNLDRCLTFDGIDDYAQVSGAADASTSLGVAFWLRCNTPGEMVLLDKFPSDSSGTGWRVWLDTAGRLHFTIGSLGASTDLASGQPVAVNGLWRHVGCTFTGGKATLFINGQAVAEATEISYTPASSGLLTIGKSNAVAFGQPFYGRMDELSVYTTSLNDLRIQSMPGLAFQEQFGTIGYWKLDDLAGTTASDHSAMSSNGTLNGGMTFEQNAVSGVWGKALSFDGTDDYIQITNGTSTPGTGFSVSMWVYPTAMKTWARFIDFGNGSGSDNILLARYSNSNDLIFECYNGSTNGGSVQAAGAIELNKWQHFAATLDSAGNTKLYKNGTLIKSGTTGLFKKIARINSYLGKSNWNADQLYQGIMDEVQIFNSALTQQQIQTLMNGSWAMAPSPKDQYLLASTQPMLGWQGTTSAVMYGIYLGTDSAAVTAATPASPEFQGYRQTGLFNPGTLNANTIYYWRVDSILENGMTIPGSVWNFTTSGSLTRQVYTGITGESVSNLTSASKYPNNPDMYDTVTTFESATDWLDTYGTRLEGYLTPQTSGSYTFWIAADDSCELWLSTTDSPANIARIAYSTTYTNSRQWAKYSTQKSATRSLTSGQRYYIRALQKEGGGGDNLAVAWQGPDCPTRSVIQSRFLTPYVTRAAPMFTEEVYTQSEAAEGKVYQKSITSNMATSGTFTYTKMAGPTWLQVSSAGVLSGTPANGDKGLTSVLVQASDAWGRTDQAVIQIPVVETYNGGWGTSDLTAFAESWLDTQAGSPANLNTDSIVNLLDLNLFAGQWQQDIQAGLMAHWTMDDTEASTLRDIYAGQDATLMNSQINRTAPGMQGNALLLDGVNDYAVASGFKGIGGTQARTCAAWIKTSASGTEQTILSWGNSAAGQKWLFRLQPTGELAVVVWAGNFKTVTPVNDGRWHHVAAVLPAKDIPSITDIKLYVDGQLQTNAFPNSMQTIHTALTEDVQIGSFVSGGQQVAFFKGLTDEVRLYDRALDDAEIAWLARSGLAAHWPINEGLGTVVHEQVAQAHARMLNMDQTNWTAGRAGTALDFNGTEECLAVSGFTGIAGSAARTCAAWIKTTPSSTADQNILSWGTAATGQKWMFRTQAFTGELSVAIWGGYCKGQVSVCDDQWHHVAAVLRDDGSPTVDEILLYVDGQLQTPSFVNSQAVNTL